MDTNWSIVSTPKNTSSTLENVVTVNYYSAVTNCVFLVLLSIPGLLANGAVLLSTRCKKGVHCVQYGLHYALIAISLVFCVVWLPLHVSQTLLLYSGGSGTHPALCFLTSALLHFCLAGIVCLSVSLGALHLNYLSLSPVPQLRSLVRRSLPASLVTALLIAILGTVEQPRNLSHELCSSGIFVEGSQKFIVKDSDKVSDERVDVEGGASLFAGQDVNGNDIEKGVTGQVYVFWYSLLSLLLAIAYSAMLLIMMVVLWLALQAMRTGLAEMTSTPHRDGCTGRPSESGMAADEDVYEISRGDEPSKHSSVTFKDPEISETIPDNSRICSIRKSPSPKTFKFKDIAGDSDEEDDVTFDRKMRLRMQKTGSGRRHTVANIGLGDSSNRRGSLDVPSNGPNCAKSYNYIRKWSVDITALQAQLENPRTHTGSFPFRDLGILPENPKKSSPDSINEVDENEENVGAMPGSNETKNPDSATEQSTTNNNSNGIADDSTKRCDNISKEQKPVKTNGCHRSHTTQDFTDVKETTNNTHNIIEEEEIEADRPLLTHVPSITINEKPQTFSIEKLKDKTPFQDQAAIKNANQVEDDVLRRLYKKVSKTKHFINFYLITLLLMTPLFLVYLLQPLLGPHLVVNLSATLAPLAAVCGIVHPLYLAWMDTRLNNAMTRLWVKLTHWTCVCYCNIGKGKRLFGKPDEPVVEDKPQAETHSSVC